MAVLLFKRLHPQPALPNNPVTLRVLTISRLSKQFQFLRISVAALLLLSKGFSEFQKKSIERGDLHKEEEYYRKIGTLENARKD